MAAGAIQFENFTGLTSMPQKAASAWSAFEQSGFVGASYKPLLYVGKQQVDDEDNGVNHWFIAEQTLVTAKPLRHIVAIAINELDGAYTIVPSSVKVLIA